MTDLCEATSPGFGGIQRFIRHDSQILGRVNTRRIGFLHERLVNRDIAKLDLVFGFRFIVNDFNLGKLANDKGEHLVHKVVKHGDRVGCVGLRALLAEQESILQRFVPLPLGIKGLRILDSSCTTWKHFAKLVCCKKCVSANRTPVQKNICFFNSSL